jgi:hypothetical protein
MYDTAGRPGEAPLFNVDRVTEFEKFLLIARNDLGSLCMERKLKPMRLGFEEAEIQAPLPTRAVAISCNKICGKIVSMHSRFEGKDVDEKGPQE